MGGDLLFVPAGPSSKRQKELAYAASKSHLAKIAHRRRRKTLPSYSAPVQPHASVDRGSLTTTSTEAVDLHRHNGAHKSRSTVILDRVYKGQLPSTRLEPVLHRQPCILFGDHDSYVGHPSIATSPEVMHTIHFAQFHLASSCSPPFMQRMSGKGKSIVSDRDLMVTEQGMSRWLWKLWSSDTGLFWAILASVIPLMTRYTSGQESINLQHTALQLKARSLKDLQRALYQNTNPLSSRLLMAVYHVKALFREACASGDTKAAVHHTRMVEELADMLIQRDPSLQYLQLALWTDALPALLQMRRPIVQYSSWMTPIVETIWTDAEKILPKTDCDRATGSKCITNSTVQDAFTHLHRTLQLINSGWLASETMRDGTRKSELTFRWMTTKAEYHICHLLNFYLDTVKSQPNNSINPLLTAISSKAIHMQSLHIDQAFALALLYLYQKTFFIMYSPQQGLDIHESAYSIYPHFLNIMQLYTQCHCLEEEQNSNFSEEAQIWLVSIGAEMERSLSLARAQNEDMLIAASLSHINSGDFTWFRSQLSTRVSISEAGLLDVIIDLPKDLIWNSMVFADNAL